MSWQIVLPFVPLSMNERERTSWAHRRKELQQIRKWVAAARADQGIPEATGRRHVHVVVVKAARYKRHDDPSNLYARSKSVLDALVHERLLVDDRGRDLEFSTEERFADQRQTIIEIAELPATPEGGDDATA